MLKHDFAEDLSCLLFFPPWSDRWLSWCCGLKRACIATWSNTSPRRRRKSWRAWPGPATHRCGKSSEPTRALCPPANRLAVKHTKSPRSRTPGFLQGDRRWRFLSETKSETWLKCFSWLNDRSEALQFLYTCGFNGGLVSFVGDPLCTTWRSDEDGRATWRKPTRRYEHSLLKGSHK